MYHLQQPVDALVVQTEELDITNVSSLPLTAVLGLKHPFQLLMDDQIINDAVSIPT